MVENPFHTMEWAEPDSSELLHHNRDQCLEEKLGAVSLHRGPMEPQGEQKVHQLPGTPGCLSGT